MYRFVKLVHFAVQQKLVIINCSHCKLTVYTTVNQLYTYIYIYIYIYINKVLTKGWQVERRPLRMERKLAACKQCRHPCVVWETMGPLWIWKEEVFLLSLEALAWKYLSKLKALSKKQSNCQSFATWQDVQMNSHFQMHIWIRNVVKIALL